MKKLTLLLGAFLAVSVVFGQAVRDRNVIPVAVNLNQVLRMTITNGGNIEFVFNSIDDYRLGLSGDQANLDNEADADVTAGGSSANPLATGPGTGVATNFYKTDFTVASSTRWKLEWGSEEATFMGTDTDANTLTLDNVGFGLKNLGVHVFEGTGNAKATTDATAAAQTVLFSSPTDNGNSVTALVAYPAANPLIEDNDDAGAATFANAGDASDNSFELIWRCGTTEAGNGNLTVAPMNSTTLLNQGDINPDRYVTNVVFELATDF